MYKGTLGMIAAGLAAGTVTGLFGGGGGMILVPLLGLLTPLKDEAVFSASISIILPICVLSLLLSPSVDWHSVLPWLTGSLLGGILAGKWGSQIPVKWLHRLLGLLILWGGIRYLC